MIARGLARTVLLLGGSGRTGGRVLAQLLARDVAVRAIVRSAVRLPESAHGHPLLTVIEAEVMSLSRTELQRYLEGCDTVISCLGHTISVRGIFGPPFDLVAQALSKLATAVRDMRPATPVHFILMASVSVRQPGARETVRGTGQRLLLWVLRVLVPPVRDNQRAAEFLAREVGGSDPYIEWVVVRPDTLREGEVTSYRVNDEPVSPLSKPDETNMANVAHFMCELTCDETAWARWRSRMPVVVNTARVAEAATANETRRAGKGAGATVLLRRRHPLRSSP